MSEVYKPIEGCRACHSKDLMVVIDLGNQMLSDFREDDSRPPEAPLTLMMCEKCSLVQLAHTVSRDLLYHKNYGFRSGVNEGIVKDLQDIVNLGITYMNGRRWLDIASNDGTLLSFVPKRFYRVGVDPVEKFADEAIEHANEIIPDYFSAKAVEDMKFDIITSISMFYDIDDLNEFIGEVASVLAKEGSWIIQQNYLYDMLNLGAIDNVCHEHLTYFSVSTLEALLNQHGLFIVQASSSAVNGGVFRAVVQHYGHKDSGGRGAESRFTVNRMLNREKAVGLSEPGTLAYFADRSRHNLDKLIEVVDDSSNQPIDIYGASTRGAVLWQAAGIDRTRVSFAVERQPEKVGKWFSPIGVEIISEEEMRRTPPQSLLIGPWWHRDSFVKREKKFLADGGRMIFPLPTVEVVRS